MDFKRIEKAMKEGRYIMIKDFEKDIRLMVTNAQKYNCEGSDIYVDSIIIEKLFCEALRQLEHGESDIFIEPGSISSEKLDDGDDNDEEMA